MSKGDDPICSTTLGITAVGIGWTVVGVGAVVSATGDVVMLARKPGELHPAPTAVAITNNRRRIM